MITTSPSRRPSLSTRPRPSKGRRVSFAEPSDDESSQKDLLVESDWSEVSRHPPAPVPYDSGLSGTSPDAQCYSMQMAPPMSGTIGGASPTNFFVGQPPVPPRPYWMARQPQLGDHSLGFQSLTDVVAEEADGEHDESWLPSLRNLCVAVLLGVVLTVVIFVAVVVEMPGTFDRPETSPRSFRIGMGDNRKAVAPLEPVNVPPSRDVTAHPAIPAATPNTVNPQPVARTRNHPQRALNRTRLRRRGHRCGSHFYTYCGQERRTGEAYYSASSHRCVSALGDSVHVCNRGANRFADLDSCQDSCVRRGRQTPRERCFESPLFTDCSLQDAVEQWWFFDGAGCALWNFPLGRCPGGQSGVFPSREECETTCNDDDDERRCDIPVAATCTPAQIKFPYFADMRAKGRARCVQASSAELLARRCLIGSNRFDSLSACNRMCAWKGKVKP